MTQIKDNEVENQNMIKASNKVETDIHSYFLPDYSLSIKTVPKGSIENEEQVIDQSFINYYRGTFRDSREWWFQVTNEYLPFSTENIENLKLCFKYAKFLRGIRFNTQRNGFQNIIKLLNSLPDEIKTTKEIFIQQAEVYQYYWAKGAYNLSFLQFILKFFPMGQNDEEKEKYKQKFKYNTKDLENLLVFPESEDTVIEMTEDYGWRKEFSLTLSKAIIFSNYSNIKFLDLEHCKFLDKAHCLFFNAFSIENKNLNIEKLQLSYCEFGFGSLYSMWKNLGKCQFVQELVICTPKVDGEVSYRTIWYAKGNDDFFCTPKLTYEFNDYLDENARLPKDVRYILEHEFDGLTVIGK
eukprot:snap_masked-scaffold_3-processed-gene-21.49-mRNA-1 protein AED:1.00 eAED:1.00 QI:0/-1/0/0/-1/1/1/0/352